MAKGQPQNPNLFEFATSELSQDAVICWILAWGCDRYAHTNDRLRLMAKAFAARLLETDQRFEGISGEDVLRVRELLQQSGQIDVYAEIEVREHETFRLVVEDKTDTSHHGNQLSRYREAIERKAPKDPNVFVYFKTGFWTDHDLLALSKHHYSGFTLPDFRAFLENYRGAHPILTTYCEYLDKTHEEACSCETNARSDDPSAHAEALAQPRGQWALVNDLFREAARGLVTEPPSARPSFRRACMGRAARNEIHKGSSRGAPWTHFRFHLSNPSDERNSELLFYRVDFRSRDGGWHPCLSLRKYWGFDKRNEAEAQLSAERLQCFRAVAQKAIDDSGAPAHVPGAGFGNWEQRVAHFDLGRGGTTPRELRDLLPEFHERLLDGIEKAELGPLTVEETTLPGT